jgi:branched-subunit amino acid aminotransferase/4-amino-4-deoxychorismate lyase
MNKALIFGVVTHILENGKNERKLSFVQVPQNLPRFYEFDRDEELGFLPIEEIIRWKIDKLYRNIEIESVSLWTYPEPDPRNTPQVKGPDLSLCQQLRRHANMNGADEAVITNSKGFVAEGALSALVWWRGDVLCSSDEKTNWLPSITRQEVFSIAEQMGFATKVENVKPEELAKLPIWALSSLNGIMPVRSWVGVASELPESVNLDAFLKRLKLLSTQLD